MKMKTIKFLAVLAFLVSPLYGASDRFGNERREVFRSSFTDTSPNLNVVIASVSANGLGTFVVRDVIFSGVNPTTVTFYDAIHFTNEVSTVARVEFIPEPNGEGKPVSIPLDIFCSSGVMYSKQGAAPVKIGWDYLSPGEYKGKKGDPRN